MNQVEVRRRQIQIVSCMMGLINLWIFGKYIGENGVAYLAAAWELFLVIWMVTGSKVSDTLGRMLRVRYSRGQYKNASKLRKDVFIQQSVAGFLGAALLFCVAGIASEKLFRMSYCRFLLLLLSPAVLIKSGSSVFLGYFQGDGSELPSAVTSVLRQILVLGFGLLFGRTLGGYGEKVSALLGQEAFSAMYGGIGIVLAILVAELLILLFLILVYKGSRHVRDNRDLEGKKGTESFIGHIFSLYRNMGGKILLGLLESLPLLLGLIFYQKSTINSNRADVCYGIYVGKYLVFMGLAFLLAAIIAVQKSAKVSVHVRKDEQRYAKERFQSGIRIIVIHSLFFAVYAATMSNQLAGIFGSGSETELAEMFRGGFWLIPCAALAYYFSRTLILLNKEYFAYVCAAIGDITFIISCVILLNAGGNSIQALVYAGCLGAGVYAVCAGVMICRLLRSSVDWLYSFAIPIGSACMVGLLCLFLGKSLTSHLGSGVTVIVCLVLGCMVYWALLLLLHCFREQELDDIPGGRILRFIGKMLHVL